MKTNRFIRVTLGLTAALLLCTVAVTVAIDPLLRYHLPRFGLRPVITNTRYQGAGMAENYDYDCAIIGNSIAANMVASEAEDILGCRTVKLVMFGSHMLDWTYLMDVIMSREKQPEYILIHIDPLLLEASTTELKHELPTYLYDNNPLNDAPYWFNWSIHKKFTVEMVERNNQNDIPDYENSSSYSKRTPAEVIASHVRGDVTDLSGQAGQIMTVAMENIDLLTPYIEQMENTRFIFYFSPFSALFWDDFIRNNTINAWQNVYEQVAGRLMAYENCSFYLFDDAEMKTWMEDLSHNRDSFHYDRVVSKAILERIASGSGLMTTEKMSERIGEYFAYLRGLDCDAMYFSA